MVERGRCPWEGSAALLNLCHWPMEPNETILALLALPPAGAAAQGRIAWLLHCCASFPRRAGSGRFARYAEAVSCILGIPVARPDSVMVPKGC